MSKAAVLVVLIGFAAGCGGSSSSPTPAGAQFSAALSPGEEVMPAGVVNNSQGRGSALFTFRSDGVSLDYLLNVTNIENVHMAHIHQGPVGANGPVVAWMFPSTTPGAGPLGTGPVQGVLSGGTITAAHLVGPLAGQPISALIAAIEAGNTYVNVHTNDGVAPTDTGPGDFPAGEIRGQID